MVTPCHLQWQQGSWTKDRLLKSDGDQLGLVIRLTTVFSLTMLFPSRLFQKSN